MPASTPRQRSHLVPARVAFLAGFVLSLSAGCGEAVEPGTSEGSSAVTPVVLPAGIDPNSFDPVVLELVREKLRATVENPDSSAAWSELADVWIAHSRDDLAVDPATRAVELAPDSARRRLLLAVAFEGVGEVQAALDAARMAVELDPDNAALTWTAGRLALDAGDIEAARQLAVRSSTLDPGDARARQLLALVELADGDFAAAIASVEPVVREDPDDLASRFLLGRGLQLAGKDAAAARQLTVAGSARPVFINPWAAEVRAGRVDRNHRLQQVASLAGEGRLEEALALADELEARYGSEKEITFSRVVAHTLAGRPEDVVAAADVVILAEPDWSPPRLRAGLASLAIAMRKMPPEPDGVARARAEGERCVALSPGDPQSHELLGRGLAADGRWAEALLVFRRCLDMAPSVARYHIAVGDCLVETGGHLEAINLMRRMNATFGRSVDATLVESRALAVSGRSDEARRLLEQCRKALPSHPDIGRTERVVLEAGG